LAAFDFVAVGEHGVLNFSAIEKCAVAALAVHNAAALRTALHNKVQAGHERVVREREVGARGRAANGDGLAGRQGNFLSLEGAGFNFKK
jgi:hypothetical protein